MNGETDIKSLVADMPSKLRGHVAVMSQGELAVLEFARSQAGLARMEEMCGKGFPPVVALSDMLVAQIGPEVRHQNAVKQRAGKYTRFLLEGAGWQFSGSRPVQDQVFASGAVYLRSPANGSRASEREGGHSLLRRFVASLTGAELTELKAAIKEVDGGRK